MPQDKFLLKIFSGPNQGAEVALNEEDLLVGSSPECDLVLSDALASPKHAKISVKTDSLSIEPIEANVYLDGQELTLAAHTFNPFQFITVGTTHMVIGPAEADWPPLSTADVPELKKIKKEGPSPAPDSTTAEASATEITSEDTSKPTEEKLLSDETTAKEIAEESPLLVEKKTNNILIGAAALCFLLILGAIAAYLFMQPSEVAITVKENLVAQIDPILDQFKVKDVFTVKKQGDNIFVEGYVKNNDERDALNAALRRLGPKVQTQIWSQELIKKNIDDMISMWKLPIAAESLGSGKFHLIGYYGDAHEWERLKESIKDDVLGIKLLKDDVFTSAKLAPIAISILRYHNLVGLVDLVAQRDSIIAKGNISKVKLPDLKATLANLQAKVGMDVPIQNQVLIGETEKLYVDLEIDSVLIGAQGVIIGKNGERYYEGGVLPGGAIVEKISRDGITLKKGNETVTLNIGENKDEQKQ